MIESRKRHHLSGVLTNEGLSCRRSETKSIAYAWKLDNDWRKAIINTVKLHCEWYSSNSNIKNSTFFFVNKLHYLFSCSCTHFHLHWLNVCEQFKQRWKTTNLSATCLVSTACRTGCSVTGKPEGPECAGVMPYAPRRTAFWAGLSRTGWVCGEAAPDVKCDEKMELTWRVTSTADGTWWLGGPVTTAIVFVASQYIIISYHHCTPNIYGCSC